MPAPVASPVADLGQWPVPISELFYSFQGEGPNLGRRALFIRFRDCNLTCGYAAAPGSANTPATGTMRCDTEYTWNGAKHDLSTGVQHLTPQQIWDELMRLDPSTTNPGLAAVDLIVASGGEPLLRKNALLYLANQAVSTGRRMEIETNATITPGANLIAAGVAFNAGLKLASSAVPRSRRIKPAAITAIQASGQARWKFVVCGPDDVAEIAQLQAQFGLTEIWLSPEGTTAAAVIEQMRRAAVPALEHGWNLTTREHVLIWGDERGK
ncbi:radical SAM protein [Acrocarpospora pleiomorpha]|uniref:7-carboxy-7-deazaguanine synthase n=1 Tax=Acrocarpospora pleiomorpha TaxID=90975 RepID=A0A5M3XQH7_9ACTN|nr:7-carboxy-7-deazaguanine synthase QueE [Acrocarpospora pleiomorpha]GES23575.1 radical SAM protein [Acrocarpospora pleiomorpha]